MKMQEQDDDNIKDIKKFERSLSNKSVSCLKDPHLKDKDKNLMNKTVIANRPSNLTPNKPAAYYNENNSNDKCYK